MTAPTRSGDDLTAGAHPDSVGYLDQLVAGLLAEARDEDVRLDPTVVRQAATGPDDFATRLHTYRQLRTGLTRALDDRYESASGYASMEEFWDDAAEQERGRSSRAYWDSYENGRRRQVEQLLADAFGTEQAVLVNSGMSAVDVALRGLTRPDRALLAHSRMYFESADLLDALFAPWGLPVTRIDLTDADAVESLVRSHPPAVALLEVALNGPGCDVPVLEPLWRAGLTTVVDVSALGTAVAPLVPHAPADTIFVESGTKYLTRQASVGVIYGGGATVEVARSCARRTGIQLQGRALHQIRPAEIRHAPLRHALHADRLRRFAAVVTGALPDVTVRTATVGAAGRPDLLARTVADGAAGCMAFVQVGGLDSDREERAYREIVARWAATVPGDRRVRAGFGWTETTGRAYGRDALNTDEGNCFARFSVGVEPVHRVEELADRLVSAILEVRR